MRARAVLAALLLPLPTFAAAPSPTPRKPKAQRLMLAALPEPALVRPPAPSWVLDEKNAPPALKALYDGAVFQAQAGAVTAPDLGALLVPGQAALPRTTPEKKTAPEPEFDEAWRSVAKGLWSRKGSQAALGILSSRFQLSEDSPTGLTVDSPEALRMLALAVYDRKGGDAALKELDRQMLLVAGLAPEQKKAFAAEFKSPRTAYVALAMSRVPHFAESQLYFKRMNELLGPDGPPLSGFIRDFDPTERFAFIFLLRAHAYDALIPYLNKRPEEAGALAPLLFSEPKRAQLTSRAARLEGFAVQLAAQGRDSGALKSFLEALLKPDWADPALARRIALFLKLNEDSWPPEYRARVDEAAKDLPPGLLDDPSLKKEPPYAAWPRDVWKFTLHFAHNESFEGWLDYFKARGFSFEPENQGGVTLSKAGPVKLVLVAKMYSGDEEGFLRGDEARRFETSVSADLKDPGVQGVILRTHAQFSSRNLFGKGVSDGKFWLDGSCRGAWDMPVLEGRCKDCSLVANVGTGVGAVNNRALYVIVDGLMKKKSWAEIGAALRSALPAASAKFEGPWTPPYGKALALLSPR